MSKPEVKVTLPPSCLLLKVTCLVFLNFFSRLALPEWQAPGAVEAAADPILPEVGADGVEIRKPSPASGAAAPNVVVLC